MYGEGEGYCPEYHLREGGTFDDRPALCGVTSGRGVELIPLREWDGETKNLCPECVTLAKAIYEEE